MMLSLRQIKWHLAINSKGKVYVHYYRDFLPGSQYPRVAADKNGNGSKSIN